MSEQPKDTYESPEVEQVEAEDLPAVTAAGDATDGAPPP
jgi:hypothetical protein